jgi:hypothetical protein
MSRRGTGRPGAHVLTADRIGASARIFTLMAYPLYRSGDILAILYLYAHICEFLYIGFSVLKLALIDMK